MLSEKCQQQGAFAPRALPRLTTPTRPSATLSPSVHFPVLPVIRRTFLQPFLSGARRVSPVASPALAIMPSCLPRRSGTAVSVKVRLPMLPSPLRGRLGLRTFALSRPLPRSHALRPDDSLPLLERDLSVGFIRFVSSTDATQATGLLTLTPVGLPPTEQTSLPWTHYAACGFPALRTPARFMPRCMGPLRLGALSTAAAEANGHCSAQISPDYRTATAYSTSSSRSPDVSVPASSVAASSSPPSPVHDRSSDSHHRWQSK